MPRTDSTAIIIPARYKSSRFPGKPLVDLAGKPMIARVAEKCMQAISRDAVFVATDDDRIREACEQHQINVIMTADNHPTGTDRIAEAASKIDADFMINVQGDEPLIQPEDIQRVIDEKRKYPADIINAYCPLSADENPAWNTIPKVVFNEAGDLVYMSRSVIPGLKEGGATPTYHKQVCIYGFTREQLQRYASFGRKSVLESFEDIEILRFLELGINVRMVEVSASSIAVDTPEDVDRVIAAMAANE